MSTTRQQLGIETASFRYVWGRGVIPTEPPAAMPERLRINVVFTEIQSTELALKRAVELAIDLGAETQIIVPHIVPYPLALECPVVPLEFMCKQLEILAASVGADPYIHVYLCRDAIALLRKLLPPGSIAVLHARNRWLFPSKSQRIARALQRYGCAVVVV